VSRVVIAHEEAKIREPALDVARQLGLEAVGVSEGESAKALLRWAAPDVLVVDVGLPGVLGFELIEEIRRLALPTQVILIASVYSKTAYKRRPTSLYGAFDYIEQHHIVDDLADKLWAAIGDSEDSPERNVGEVTMQRERGEIADAGVRRLRYDAAMLSPEANAGRLARLLVADVLLYAGETAEAWIETGAHPADLPDQLHEDLREARRLFNAEVPESVRARADYLGEALRRAVVRSSLDTTQPLNPIDD
jgi:DNA-binding NarL/FixJ family response regulator